MENKNFILILLFFCMSYLATNIQFYRLGFDYVCNEEYNRQLKIFNGEAEAPMQYRPLSSYLLVYTTKGFDFLVGNLAGNFINNLLHTRSVEPEKAPFFLVCMVIKTMQYMTIFFLYYFFIKGWFKIEEILLAIFFLFYCIIRSFYNEGLNFYEHFNLIFLLCSFIVMKLNKDFFLLILIPISIFNKETMLLFPFIYLVVRWTKQNNYKNIIQFLLLLILSGIVFTFIRVHYGAFLPYKTIRPLGIGMFIFNISHPWTYINNLLFFHIMLIWSWNGLNNITKFFRRSFVATLCTFIPIHLFFARTDEVRLFLILTIFMIPLTMNNILRLNKKFT
jgi:hypothetical protein